MGLDAGAVVDGHLRVRGVDGLRVADCSVMPSQVSGNTNGPAMALGYRAAELFLLGRTGRRTGIRSSHRSHNSQAGTRGITRFEHIKEVYGDAASFSSENQTRIDALLGAPLRMVPTEADAPSHGGVREVLPTIFAPNRLTTIDASLMAMSRVLIGTFAGAGRCEFMSDCAQKFSIGVFLGLMGLPHSDFDMLDTWAKALSHSPDFMVKRESICH